MHIGAALKLQFISWEGSSTSSAHALLPAKSTQRKLKEKKKRLRSMFGADDWGGTARRRVGPEGRHLLPFFLSLPPESRIQAGWPAAKSSFWFVCLFFFFFWRKTKSSPAENLPCQRQPEIGINACGSDSEACLRPPRAKRADR